MSKFNRNGPRRYDRNVRVAMARKQLRETFQQEDLYDILGALTRYPGVTRIDAEALPAQSKAYVNGLRAALSGLVKMNSFLKGLITDAYLRERVTMDRMLDECMVHNDLSWAKINLRLPDNAPAADKAQATSVLVGFSESARGRRFAVIADPKVFPNMVGWDIDVQINSEEEILRRKLKRNQVATFRGRRLMDYEAINDRENNPRRFIFDYKLIRAGRVAQEFGHHLYGALQGNPQSTEAFTRRFLDYARDIDGLFAGGELAANVEEVAASVSEAMAAFRAVKDAGLDGAEVAKAVSQTVEATELQSPVMHEVPAAAVSKPLPRDTIFGPRELTVYKVVSSVVAAAEKRPGPQEVVVDGREFHVMGHALDEVEQEIAFQIWSKDLNLVQMTWSPSERAQAAAEAAWDGLTSSPDFMELLPAIDPGLHDFGGDGFQLGVEARYTGDQQDIWLHVEGERVHKRRATVDQAPAAAHGDSLAEAVHDVTVAADVQPEAPAPIDHQVEEESDISA